MKKAILFTLSFSALFYACGPITPTLPSATGTRFEILIVMDDDQWKAPAGRSLVALFNRDMEALPQSEPVMTIHQTSRAHFGDLLKPSRNILITEIASHFDSVQVIYGRNQWSRPQSVVKISARNDSMFVEFMKREGEQVLNYFLVTERNRQIEIGRNFLNRSAIREIENMFGIQVDIPSELSKTTKGKDFFWATNDHAHNRMDMIIYSYPYTDKNTFTPEYLIAKRDSVLRVNVPGEFEGSFMGTEVRHHFPIFREFNLNNTYCMEMRGLWRMFNGGSMGGPFVSHTRVDEVNQRVITVEGFVFAPGRRKRNSIRQLEAAVFTTLLPQEINALNEVSVVAEKKN